MQWEGKERGERQKEPAPTNEDLRRARVALYRLYERAIQLALAAQIERKKDRKPRLAA